jgi:hypothetical protein
MVYLEFGVIKERARYSSVTRPQLIEDVKIWAARSEPTREAHEDELEKVCRKTKIVPWRAVFTYAWEGRAADLQYSDSPCYHSFIQIGRECVDSELAAEDRRECYFGQEIRLIGWINLVNSPWSPRPPMELEGGFKPSPRDREIVFHNSC